MVEMGLSSLTYWLTPQWETNFAKCGIKTHTFIILRLEKFTGIKTDFLRRLIMGNDFFSLLRKSLGILAHFFNVIIRVCCNRKSHCTAVYWNPNKLDLITSFNLSQNKQCYGNKYRVSKKNVNIRYFGTKYKHTLIYIIKDLFLILKKQNIFRHIIS